MATKISLEHAVTYTDEDGEEISLSTLSIGRLKLKHLKVLPSEVFDSATEGGLNPSKLIPALPSLVSALANIPLEAAEEIDFEDLGSIVESLTDFLGGIRGEVGSKPSGS